MFKRFSAASNGLRKVEDAKPASHAYPSKSDEYARWTFDDVEPAARRQDVRDWITSVGLVPQENYLVDPSVGFVRLGLGWDRGVDVDASVALYDDCGRNVDCVWYKKLQSACGSVVHSGDNLTGVGDGDDEVISVKLSEIPLHVHHLLFTVCIFSCGVSFREVRAAYVRMMHGKEKYKNHEMCRFSLDQMSGHAMLMGLLVRKGPYWNFKALGKPASGRTIVELLQNPSNLKCLTENPSQRPEYRHVSVAVLAGRGFILEFKGKKYTSEYQSKTLEPQWKPPPFQLGHMTEVEPKTLKVQVFDYDVVGTHDFMGMVRIPGHAIFNLGPGEHTFWFALGDTKDKAHRHEDVSGEILVSFRIHVEQNYTY